MMLNSVASVVIGIYIIAAIARGNGDKLLQQLATDAKATDRLPGLVQWLVAILVLNFLASNQKTKSVGGPLLFAAYAGLGIQFVSRNGIEDARSRIQQLWNLVGFNTERG